MSIGYWEAVPPPIPKHFIVGLDLAQTHDKTGMVTADRKTDNERATYDVINIVRAPDRTPYPDIVRQVGAWVDHLRAERPQPTVDLVIDGTGVGRPIVDLFTEADYDCRVSAVTIHGGNATVRDGLWFSVPKRDLVGTVRKLMETKRLQLGEDVPLRRDLQQEARNFKYTMNKNGHISFAAGTGIGADDWRDGGKHDDLVLALALSLWFGEEQSGPAFAATAEEMGAFFAW